MAALLIGYLAAALTFTTFYMKQPKRLREVAMGSNVCFITYGAIAHVYPVMILHLLLLPLNLLRLMDLNRLLTKVQASLRGEIGMEWLKPFTQHDTFPAGTMLFRKGDPAGPSTTWSRARCSYPSSNTALAPESCLGRWRCSRRNRNAASVHRRPPT